MTEFFVAVGMAILGIGMGVCLFVMLYCIMVIFMRAFGSDV